MCVLKWVSLMYVCIVKISTFGITTEPRVLQEEYNTTCCPDSESISNITRNGNVSLSQGPPIFIFPMERKSFLVAEGQPIQFTITVGSFPLPYQSLTIWRSSLKTGVGIDVNFKRTSSSALEKVPDGMPVYNADVKLTNITMYWTGDFTLFVNNSYGSVTYNFSVIVHKPDKVSWWRSYTEIFVGIGVGVLLMVTLVVGTIIMCRSRYKQKVLQETVKDLEEAELEKKGSMDSLDIWGLDDGNKELDSLSEEAPNRQLQSMNTFNNPEETSDGNL